MMSSQFQQVEPSQIDIISAWIARTLNPLCLLFVIHLIKTEIQSRNRIKNNEQTLNNPTTTTKYFQTWLARWSLFAMICNALALVSQILLKIPFICHYIYAFPTIFWYTSQAFVTLYQSTRLQYCFASKQIHSNKYGYNQSIFYALYIIGPLSIIFAFIPFWFIMTTASIGDYGCILIRPNVSDSLITLITFSVITSITIYDMVVLLLYIVKVCQIKKVKIFKVDAIYKRIQFILKKILFLTVAYEIKSWIVALVLFMTLYAGIYGTLLANIVMSLDQCVACLITYLMIEHNNDKYVAIMDYLCCYGSDDTYSNKKELDQIGGMTDAKRSKTQHTVTDSTKTDIDNKVEMYHTQCQDIDISVLDDTDQQNCIDRNISEPS